MVGIFDPNCDLVNKVNAFFLRLNASWCKLRFIGITEGFNSDSGHDMLQRALQDDVWDVMMVGFNILNQSARERVFPTAMEKNVGILIMFAVRRALSSRTG